MTYSRPSLSSLVNKSELDSLIKDKYFSNKSPQAISKSKEKKSNPGFLVKENTLKDFSYRSKEAILNQIDSSFYDKEKKLLGELSNAIKNLYIFYTDKQREMRKSRSELVEPFRYRKFIQTRLYITNKLISLLKELYKK